MTSGKHALIAVFDMVSAPKQGAGNVIYRINAEEINLSVAIDGFG
jgi:hypothetical protein